MSARHLFLTLLLVFPTFMTAGCKKKVEPVRVEEPPAPEVRLQVTAVDPDRPEPRQSFRATIFGSGFQNGARVWVGEREISTPVFRDSNSLAVSIPTLDPGTYDVRVQNPDGESASLRAGIIVRESAPTLPEICRNLRVGFDFDSATLNSNAQSTLRNAEQCFTAPGTHYRIEGHCDERGTTEYNLALGQRRADAVQRYIVARGVTPNRISTISYGEEKPLEMGANEGSWARNRRAEIIVQE